MASINPSIYSIPHTPLPSDNHPTDTFEEQSRTEQLISALLATTAPPGSPETSLPSAPPTTLRKAEHVQYIGSTLNKLPWQFTSLDASKPWLVFWTVHSLDLLGVALDQGTKDRAVSTILHFLHPSGGFSGGPANSQIPHLLPTYASVCSLAITGNASPGGGWEEVANARQGIYDFFMRCKRPDGGFVVCQGGEVDVRGTYCLLVVATLLDILTPELLRNVDKFISACQTYEGGFACSSFPFPSTPLSSSTDSDSNTDTDIYRTSMAEAHGGYTSCSLNSHFLLSSIKTPSTPSPSLDPDFPSTIDVDAALRWSALMQGEAIEAGGFRGRSNKLVDGCYSWWVGGGFPVLEALAKKSKVEGEKKKEGAAVIEAEDGKEDEWVDDTPIPLFNRVALQEYILLAAQREPGARPVPGGLRDKPGARPDLYHTCNNLSGLSIAQHNPHHTPSQVQSNRNSFDPSKGFPAVKPTTPEGGWKTEEERHSVRREVWANTLGWKEDEGEELVVGSKENRVNTTTPVFNILGLRLKPFINYFYGQS